MLGHERHTDLWMRLVTFLVRTSGAVMTLAVVAGAVSGACNAALIAWITRVLTGHSAVFWVFLALVAVKLITAYASRQWLAQVAQRTLLTLRRELARRILDARLREVEEAGAARLLAALTDDIGAIAAALSALPSLAVNLTVLVACGAYLAWLSPRMFAALLLFVAAGLFVYRLFATAAMRALRRVRAEQDHLFAHFRALTEGLVELQRHAARRRAFLDEDLEQTSATLERENLRASARFGLAHLWSQAIVYGALAAVLFGAIGLHLVDPAVLTGFVLTIVYLTGPLAAAMQTLPAFGKASVALDRVQALGWTLAAARVPSAVRPGAVPADWRRIDFDAVEHTYRSEDEPFTLGPLSLSIHRGEILFVTGGNGSGKSTLAKLIAGLYEPDAGRVSVDGVAIVDEVRGPYRELASTILSDCFLFDRLLGLDAPDLDSRARRLLDRLGLAHKVRVEGGRFSTTELSHGQRKRLALLTAALEDRALFILDEWAADQDSVFKRWFYLEWLPELRRSGRTAVVISHDDRYFAVADRIVRLEQGQLIGIETAHRIDAAPFEPALVPQGAAE
jgi:putative pyoverdin transport system ATP-binding/permease protein